MKKAVLAAVVAALGVASFGASAASLDLRTEYKHDQERFAYRAKLSESFGAWKFGIEQKFESGKLNSAHGGDGSYGGFLQNLQRGDSEFDWNYTHKFDKQLYMELGAPITFGSDSYTVKPGVRLGYRFDTEGKTRVTGRYRHEMRSYSGTSSSRNSTSDYNIHKFTGTLDHTFFGAVNAKVEGNFWENTNDRAGNVVRSHGEAPRGYDYGLILTPKMSGNVTPYAELWDSPYSTTNTVNSSLKDAKRELKSRVGIKFKF